MSSYMFVCISYAEMKTEYSSHVMCFVYLQEEEEEIKLEINVLKKVSWSLWVTLGQSTLSLVSACVNPLLKSWKANY